jgi:hypothetical protein
LCGDQDLLAGVCAAVASLTGLQSLRVHATLLRQLDVRPLAALTRVQTLVVSTCKWSCDQELMCSLLQRLAPLRGQLRHLQLDGCCEGDQEEWRSAVAAHLGDVALVLRVWYRAGKQIEEHSINWSL